MCNNGITQFYLLPTHQPYLPLLPSRKASPPFGCYSLRLPTKGWPGWVDLGGWLRTGTQMNVPHRELRELSTDTVTHPSTNQARRKWKSAVCWFAYSLWDWLVMKSFGTSLDSGKRVWPFAVVNTEQFGEGIGPLKWFGFQSSWSRSRMTSKTCQVFHVQRYIISGKNFHDDPISSEVADRQTDRRTDRRTDGRTLDKTKS